MSPNHQIASLESRTKIVEIALDEQDVVPELDQEIIQTLTLPNVQQLEDLQFQKGFLRSNQASYGAEDLVVISFYINFYEPDSWRQLGMVVHDIVMKIFAMDFEFERVSVSPRTDAFVEATIAETLIGVFEEDVP